MTESYIPLPISSFYHDDRHRDFLKIHSTSFYGLGTWEYNGEQNGVSTLMELTSSGENGKT